MDYSFSTIQYNTTVKCFILANERHISFSTIQYNTTVKSDFAAVSEV